MSSGRYWCCVSFFRWRLLLEAELVAVEAGDRCRWADGEYRILSEFLLLGGIGSSTVLLLGVDGAAASLFDKCSRLADLQMAATVGNTGTCELIMIWDAACADQNMKPCSDAHCTTPHPRRSSNQHPTSSSAIWNSAKPQAFATSSTGAETGPLIDEAVTPSPRVRGGCNLKVLPLVENIRNTATTSI